MEIILHCEDCPCIITRDNFKEHNGHSVNYFDTDEVLGFQS